jgi:hypothetical protein
MPVDIAVVGNAARGSRDGGGPKELVSFSVRKGDNGGIMVSESYESKAPEGRRKGAAFPGGFDSKENAFGPSEQEAAQGHIADLLGQMTGGPPAAAPPAPPPAGPPVRPVGPPVPRTGPPMRPPMPPFAAE